MPKLTVHEGKDGPREPPDRLECPKCNAFFGIPATVTLIEVWQNPEMDENGKIIGGHKIWVCFRCLKNAEWTPFGPSVCDEPLDEASI